ncbi:MAG: 1,4-dihydroxy-2-naphthoate octaprenyltransferase [Woeseiaceae bacterium]|nr:1,4-dihydroxy-2-naphthoate octaprenyltransferase [Woeseiaceae bacterium]
MSDATEMNPLPEQFAGTQPTQVAKRLFHATRPKFYPASVLPVLAGSAWGYAASGGFDWGVFVLALFATVCVHAGGNVLNDVGDEEIGTDRVNDDRIYPYTGGSRFIQTGILSPDSMRRLGIGLLAAAALAGTILLIEKGPMILGFGLAGVLLAIAYSLGPVKLASIGLGETAVGVAFGIIPVTGAAWLQSGTIDQSVLIFSLPIALWVTAILLINEVPDIAADSKAGKRTLPVRFGLGATSVLYFCLHLGSVVATGWLAYTGALPVLAPAVPVALLVLAAKAAAGIRTGIADRARMTSAIEGTLGIHTIGGIWLTGCALYAGVFGTG